MECDGNWYAASIQSFVMVFSLSFLWREHAERSVGSQGYFTVSYKQRTGKKLWRIGVTSILQAEEWEEAVEDWSEECGNKLNCISFFQ